MLQQTGLPPAQGLYDPTTEHDSCGVGFVVDLKGRASNQIVRDALRILISLTHRGACGCEPNTGDGAGILMQTPDRFLRRVAREAGVALPPRGDYAAGLVFLPPDSEERARCSETLEELARREGQRVLGWRDVPVHSEPLGESARLVEPVVKQLFIGRGPLTAAGDAFERKLFLIRKVAEHTVERLGLPHGRYFHQPGLSARTLCYKGMLTPPQLPAYFLDLRAPDLEAALALVHSRFSTNTFPSWELAQPFRFLCHNGEINTLRGNINWMHAREHLFECSQFTAAEMERLLPIINERGSDSAMLDNVLEMLVLGGYSLPHAVMMLIPEAWARHKTMLREKKEFYEFHACLMEPWDGPASLAFTDGTVVGAVLDRNGLRPSRYCVTADEKVILASEVGVLDLPPERILHKGRLQPGRMLLVDTRLGRIVADEELKYAMATAQPYGQWLRENLVRLEDLPAPAEVPKPDHAEIAQRQQVFGYTAEDLKIILQPMAEHAEEPLGSMGNDAPLAVLSDRPQLLYSYFKQLFAQVTNPPLDAIREELVTDLGTTLGPEGNLLRPGPRSCRHLKLGSPILSNDELGKLRGIEREGFGVVTLPILFEVPSTTEDDPGESLSRALEQLFGRAEQAVSDGVNLLILSDRAADERHAPIPALLAVAGLHHHLVRLGRRTRVALVLESGEPREVHHFALLLGYGAGAINPYLAFESLDVLLRDGLLAPSLDRHAAVKNYIKAVNKGVLKVMSKMGISTIQSYRGAQIFEAIGLCPSVVARYFTHTPSRIKGIGLPEIAREQLARHERAFPKRGRTSDQLDAGGHYQWRREGEFHLFNPETVHKLQYAVRTGSYKVFKEYTKLVDDQSQRLCTLRGLFQFKKRHPVPLDEVEPVEKIVTRFATGAMSYGSISKEAHETLAIAMNRLHAWSNTGEGGEDEERYEPLPNGDSKNSAIKQVASARFGVTSRYLVAARELQIKMAQGAKPGDGGQLPAHKVYPWIAKTRHSTPFVGLISPPPHHDIYSIEDLAQLIFDLKNANPRARISVKLVAEVGIGTVAAGVAKAKADVILVAGHDGGTGASPLTSIKHAGVPWELGLAEAQQTLVLNGLRGRVILQTDGQLKTGRDIAIAALLGAEEFGFATAALVACGCVMMRVCHRDTCPVGIGTQNPELRKKFMGQPEHVINLMRFLAQELREHMAELGFRTVDEMVGHCELLDMRPALGHWKAKGLDFARIFEKPRPRRPDAAVRHVEDQDHGLAGVLDQKLIVWAREAHARGLPLRLDLPIRNTDRATGTMLGGEFTSRHPHGLPDGSVHLKFTGSAGQSFGAFIPQGITLELEGDTNDHLAKGISGGRVIVYPSKQSVFRAEENIVTGNVAAYGATGGELYVRGIAGERFCVRNSGVHAVVEGVGDHACEYMTAGRVVVLGRTGRNFAAGMSGGSAYVFDEDGDFRLRCNLEMVGLEPLEAPEDVELVRSLLQRHLQHTGSPVAKRILERWDSCRPSFVKVMPHDYKRALERQETEERSARLLPAAADWPAVAGG
jgi:glutamate synthase (ferredoxin)